MNSGARGGFANLGIARKLWLGGTLALVLTVVVAATGIVVL